MHFSQGWVQFGYRFSLDFAPWAILLVAIGLERIAARTSDAGTAMTSPRDPPAGAAATADADVARADVGIDRRALAWPFVALAITLVGLSVFVNMWGVVWGDVLGW